MSFFEELKRRNVFRVGIAYLIVSWLLLQVIDVLMPILELPEWVARFIFLLLLVGFVPVLIAAWAFELTPDGVKRERDVDRSQSITPKTSRKLDRSIIIVLALAVAFLLYKQLNPALQTPTVATEPESASALESSIENEATDGPITIAVLPFVNMSSDAEQEYFSDGITEEILNRLAKIRELQVVARTSVFSFKGQQQDIREIGEKLGVSTILEGSVRRDGERVRITAQLIRADDGFHLWSETYDRKLENIFAIQDDISSQIAAALKISLGISNNRPSSSEKLVDPEVYDLYLQARTLHRKRGEYVSKSLDLFRQALDIDPQFAPAWAGLAHSYNVISDYSSKEDLERLGDLNARSMAAAQKALELDPNLATALHAMANNLRERLEWAQAQVYYERALKLDPDSSDIMEDYASMLLYSLQLDTAEKVAERMIMLDPYVPVFQYVLIDLYNSQGKFEKRDEHIQTSLEINPEFSLTQIWELLRLLQYGQVDNAHAYVDKMNLRDWVSADGMHRAIDWMSESDQLLDQAMADAIAFAPEIAFYANRYDLWLDTMWRKPDKPGLWTVARLLAPVVTPEQSQAYLAQPQTHDLIQALRLPEYWREVGWPDVCQPYGEDDFKCH